MSEPTPDHAAIRARLTAALEPIEPGTQMEAYYYEFNETGLATIDRVLSAVAVAGKHYHNTREWHGEAPSFPNEVEAIQAAANGSAAEVKRLTDDIAALLTENEALTSDRRRIIDVFGGGESEPQPTTDDIVEWIESDHIDALDHIGCPTLCEGCGEYLAGVVCGRCHGSGDVGSINGASECGECGGVGKVHAGCVEKSYAELAADNARLHKVVDAARAIADINGFNLPLTNAAAIHNLILALDALGADQ